MTPLNLTESQKRLTLLALMTVFLLGAMDNVIVSTALPTIMAQLHGIELYAWVSTIYMLTSTVTVPIYGKLGDLYGRKGVLIVGITIFLIGSALCGLAGEFGELPVIGGGMAQLVVFRAIQGIGGGALFSSAFAIVAEIFSPRERGKYMGMLGGMFAVASIIGPAVGGFLTDYATTTLFGFEIAGWRWVFYVNLPLGLAALALITYKMPRLAHHAGGRVDYLGALLVVTTSVPLLLAFTWAGRAFAWGSPRIISLLLVSLVSLLLFLRVEARTKDAILPLELFRIRAFSTTIVAAFLMSMAFFGMVMFMPLFLQAVKGVSATQSGFTMLPMMIGMLLGATGGGNAVARVGKSKVFLVMAVSLLFIAVFSLHNIGPDTTTFGIGWRVFLVGLGMGPTQSVFTMIVQNAVDRRHLGVATSASQFFRQIGGTIGLAVFGTLLTHNLNTELARQVPQIPGVAASHEVNLGEAQAQVMDRNKISAKISAVFTAKLDTLAQACVGDATALQAVQDDPALPSSLKQEIRDFANGSHSSTEVKQEMIALRAQLAAQAQQLAQRVESGTRVAFSTAITSVFGAGLWVVALAFLSILAIPNVPLQRREHQPVEGMG